MTTETKQTLHNESLRLSESRIENPHLVLEAFFIKESLPEFRKLLHKALIAGMEDQYAWEYPDVVEFMYSFDSLTVLMEGLWLLHTAGTTITPEESKRREAPRKGDVIWSSAVQNTFKFDDYDESQFYTNKLNMEEERNPYLVISELFAWKDLGALKSELDFWCHTAVTNPWNYNAMDKEEMAALYKRMERVVEAAFVLNEIYQLKKEGQPK